MNPNYFVITTGICEIQEDRLCIDENTKWWDRETRYGNIISLVFSAFYGLSNLIMGIRKQDFSSFEFIFGAIIVFLCVASLIIGSTRKQIFDKEILFDNIDKISFKHLPFRLLIIGKIFTKNKQHRVVLMDEFKINEAELSASLKAKNLEVIWEN